MTEIGASQDNRARTSRCLFVQKLESYCLQAKLNVKQTTTFRYGESRKKGAPLCFFKKNCYISDAFLHLDKKVLSIWIHAIKSYFEMQKKNYSHDSCARRRG